MSIHAQRARYLPVERGFNIARPPIDPQAFVAEMTRAFADEAPTGFTPLDLSAVLGTTYAATTPFMLARYARVRRGRATGLHAPGERRDVGYPARMRNLGARRRNAGMAREGHVRPAGRRRLDMADRRGCRSLGHDRRADRKHALPGR
jgi:hypothetical protein